MDIWLTVVQQRLIYMYYQLPTQSNPNMRVYNFKSPQIAFGLLIEFSWNTTRTWSNSVDFNQFPLNNWTHVLTNFSAEKNEKKYFNCWYIYIHTWYSMVGISLKLENVYTRELTIVETSTLVRDEIWLIILHTLNSQVFRLLLYNIARHTRNEQVGHGSLSTWSSKLYHRTCTCKMIRLGGTCWRIFQTKRK